MPSWLLLLIAFAAVLAIFLTTPAGRRLAGALGLTLRFRDGPSGEDRAYLLRVCGGDRREVIRRIEFERERTPQQTETELYRRAIRRHMNGRSEARR